MLVVTVLLLQLAPRMLPANTEHPPKRMRIARFARENGAGEWTRTIDLLITNQLLYQLSYAGQAGDEKSIVARRTRTQNRTRT